MLRTVCSKKVENKEERNEERMNERPKKKKNKKMCDRGKHRRQNIYGLLNIICIHLLGADSKDQCSWFNKFVFIYSHIFFKFLLFFFTFNSCYIRSSYSSNSSQYQEVTKKKVEDWIKNKRNNKANRMEEIIKMNRSVEKWMKMELNCWLIKLIYHSCKLSN